MEPPEFPPNSEASRRRIPEEKNLDSMVKGRVRRKRKSLRKQFGEVFIVGDAKSAVNYALFDIFLPAAKDMTLDVIMGGLETLFNGSSGRRRRGSPPTYQQYSPLGRISYGQQPPQQVPYNRMSSPQRALSRAARARHNFDEIVLDERSEAQAVIDRLFDVVSQYEQASVADLYDLVGLSATHTDHKWGWTDLYGAGVSRVRNGYLLDLPEPEPLD